MPELPEVETIRRILGPQIMGRKIISLKVKNSQVIAHPDEKIFLNLLSGQIIENMSRRGKFLTIHFVNGDRLILHLRMTGQLLVTPAVFPEEKHTHLIAELSDGNQLRYIDVRRFGRFWYLRENETDTVTGQEKLGLEPWDEELTGNYLKEKLCYKKKTIKEMILDQSVVAGIGNIYSDEILFVSGIHPATKCTEINEEEWTCLARRIPEILSWGISVNKMSPEEYLEGKGKAYRNTPLLKVYGCSGQPCMICNSPLEKIIVGGRSSCYCPKCQGKKV